MQMKGQMHSCHCPSSPRCSTLHPTAPPCRFPSDCQPGRTAVITPYRKQLLLLRDTFARSLGSAVTADIEFNTVDGFQGREVDVLLFSAVRAHVHVQVRGKG